MNKSQILFYLSLISVLLSISIWSNLITFISPENSKITAIFVGLWAPTLMAMSNRYK